MIPLFQLWSVWPRPSRVSLVQNGLLVFLLQSQEHGSRRGHGQAYRIKSSSKDSVRKSSCGKIKIFILVKIFHQNTPNRYEDTHYIHASKDDRSIYSVLKNPAVSLKWLKLIKLKRMLGHTFRYLITYRNF